MQTFNVVGNIDEWAHELDPACKVGTTCAITTPDGMLGVFTSNKGVENRLPDVILHTPRDGDVVAQVQQCIEARFKIPVGDTRIVEAFSVPPYGFYTESVLRAKGVHKVMRLVSRMSLTEQGVHEVAAIKHPVAFQFKDPNEIFDEYTAYLSALNEKAERLKAGDDNIDGLLRTIAREEMARLVVASCI